MPDERSQILFAAYVATWVIHVFYLGTLARRFSRLRRNSGNWARRGVTTRPQMSRSFAAKPGAQDDNAFLCGSFTPYLIKHHNARTPSSS